MLTGGQLHSIALPRGRPDWHTYAQLLFPFWKHAHFAVLFDQNTLIYGYMTQPQQSADLIWCDCSKNMAGTDNLFKILTASAVQRRNRKCSTNLPIAVSGGACDATGISAGQWNCTTYTGINAGGAVGTAVDCGRGLWAKSNWLDCVLVGWMCISPSKSTTGPQWFVLYGLFRSRKNFGSEHALAGDAPLYAAHGSNIIDPG